MGRIIFLMVFCAIWLVIAMATDACTRKESAYKALLDSGFHPIEVGGYGLFKCNDAFSTEFKAYSPDSTRIVEGCVCEGIFKSKTIRLD